MRCSVAKHVVLAAVASVMAGVAAAPQARAHPHVFIEAQTQILYDKGTFTGVTHRWRFDEFYSQTAVDGLDTNKDGVYSREELAELAKVNIEGLKEFAYFTFPKVGSTEVKIAEVKDYWLEHKDGVLSLVFTLTFAEPVPADAPAFKVGVADPTFFIGFDWLKDDGVTFSANAPKTCKLTIGDPNAEKPNKDVPAISEEEALRGAFAQQFGASLIADRSVKAICPKS